MSEFNKFVVLGIIDDKCECRTTYDSLEKALGAACNYALIEDPPVLMDRWEVYSLLRKLLDVKRSVGGINVERVSPDVIDPKKILRDAAAELASMADDICALQKESEFNNSRVVKLSKLTNGLLDLAKKFSA